MCSGLVDFHRDLASKTADWQRHDNLHEHLSAWTCMTRGKMRVIALSHIGQRSQLQADLAEARTLLKLTSRQTSERLERLAAEQQASLNQAQSQLADAHR